MVETDESPVAADGSNNNSSSPTVNLYELAASCLAASIAASEPIRRIAFGSLHSPARTPAVTADDYEIASVVGTSTLVVVEEEGDVQHKTDSTRSLDTAYSAVSAVYARSAPSRQSSVTSIASRSKSDGTLVTDADGAAQRLIVHAIRSVDSRVTIVGEESSEEENRLFGDPDLWSPAEDNSSPSIPPAPSGGLLSAHQWEACWRFAQEEIQIRLAQNPDIANVETDVDPSRVSIFVDPLDGTKNYALGQFDSVSTLVAIILDNTPYFGVICKPFGNETVMCESGDVVDSPASADSGANRNYTPNCAYSVYGGLLLNGVFVAGEKEVVSPLLFSRNRASPPNGGENNLLPKAIISSSRSGGIVKRICTALYEQGALSPELVLVSGAGEKALRLIVGNQCEGLWPFPRPGTSLWDVAAADALLIQQGGRLTDAIGRPMNYAAAAFEGGSTDNDSGVFASYSLELHQICLRVFQDIQEQDNQEPPVVP